MTVMQQVGVGGVIAGGLAATAIGGYNIGHSEHAKFGQQDEKIELNNSLMQHSQSVHDALKPAVDEYTDERGERLNEWMGAGIALGVTGLAAAGLGVASIMTKNPNTAATLRTLGFAAAGGAAAAGALTWKQYSDVTSEGPAERMTAAVHREFARQQANVPAVVAAPVTGSVGALDTITGTTIAGTDPTTSVLADNYRAKSVAVDYAVHEYAGVIDQILATAGPEAGAALLHDLGMVVGSDGATTSTEVATALDINGDGTLVAVERKPIWPVLDVARYAELRDATVLSGEDPVVAMAQLMQEITSGGPLSAHIAPPQLGALAALSLDMAKHVGVDQGTGAPIDWYEVADRAEGILQRG